MVLNFHGIGGSCCNTNYTLLTERFSRDQIYSPQLDYRKTLLTTIIDSVSEDIKSEHVDFVVGNSFGGLIASYIAFQYHVPCILTNPCLVPDKIVDQLIPEYTLHNSLALSGYYKFVSLNTDFFKEAYILIGLRDEVLDPQDAIQIANRGVFTFFPNEGHRLSGPDFNIRFREMEDRIIEKSNYK